MAEAITSQSGMSDSYEANRSPIELIPVVDIMNGIVVRGVAGQRQSYLPNQSCLVDSTEPCEVATAIREAFDTRRLYVADLDGLQHGQPQWETLQILCDQPVSLCVDAGLSTTQEVHRMVSMGVHSVIIALETLKSFDQLEELAAEFSTEKLLFSLDLKHGELLSSQWKGWTPLEVIEEVVESGISQIIILDLAAVGTYDGVPTLQLCQRIRQQHQQIQIWTGGGIRSMQDVKACQQADVDGLLIASALHDGKISPSDWIV